MNPNFSEQELQTLLNRYHQEIEQLRSRLLSGEKWEQLAGCRRNVTELAIFIHKKFNVIVPESRLPDPAKEGISPGEMG